MHACAASLKLLWQKKMNNTTGKKSRETKEEGRRHLPPIAFSLALLFKQPCLLWVSFEGCFNLVWLHEEAETASTHTHTHTHTPTRTEQLFLSQKKQQFCSQSFSLSAFKLFATLNHFDHFEKFSFCRDLTEQRVGRPLREIEACDQGALTAVKENLERKNARG